MHFTRFFSLLVISLLFVSLSCAQQRGPRFSVDDQVKDLKEKLNLNDAQADTIKTILEDQREQFQKLRDNFGDDRSAMREEIGKIREETDKKINEILNDEQKEKYKEYQEERRNRMRRPPRDQ